MKKIKKILCFILTMIMIFASTITSQAATTKNPTANQLIKKSLAYMKTYKSISYCAFNNTKKEDGYEKMIIYCTADYTCNHVLAFSHGFSLYGDSDYTYESYEYKKRVFVRFYAGDFDWEEQSNTQDKYYTNKRLIEGILANLTNAKITKKTSDSYTISAKIKSGFRNGKYEKVVLTIDKTTGSLTNLYLVYSGVDRTVDFTNISYSQSKIIRPDYI